MKEIRKSVIVTDRLCMRSFSDNDIENVISLLTNDEVTKTFMVPDFETHEDAIKMFEALKRMSASDEHFVYGIYLENRLIGFINDVDICGDEIEVGYVIHPTMKNKGFATEILAASICELFDIGYSAVKAGSFEENGASIRVMQKCGMQPTAQTDEIEYRGKVHHCIYYEIRKM